jgi:hypothetical protein
MEGMNPMRAIPAVVALVALGVQPAAGQHGVSVWGDFGFGPGVLSQSAEIAIHLGANVQTGANVFTVRASAAASVLQALIDAIGGTSGTSAAGDIGVLYGRGNRGGAIRTAVAAGIGRAYVDRDSAGATVRVHRLTIPVEAQVAWRPTPVIGLAVIGFGSFNSAQSFGGLVVALQIGRMR